MNRRRRRKIILIVILVVLLACLGVWLANYSATRTLDFVFDTPESEVIDPPQYMYSFAGPEGGQMERPNGVLAVDEDVYSTDGRLARIYHFDLEGNFIQTFGEGEVLIPLYIVLGPDGNLWVTDRRMRTIFIYTRDGELVGEFEPNLPDEELPDFVSGESVWAPVGLDFGEDGSLYVTEILKGHRLLIFDPEGNFVRSVGTAGIVAQSDAGPGYFQFPNGVKVHDDEVWITDSNNRRIQIFDLEGEFLRIIPTEGLPRGFEFIQARGSDETTAPDRAIVVDTTSHDATFWTLDGERLLNFGSRGTLEGQFRYPNDIDVGPNDLLFIADTANARVQVWGWPQDLAPVAITIPQRWGYCLTPLLLLPLLLLGRKRKFYATDDFVWEMVRLETATQLPAKRRSWLTKPEHYEGIKDESFEDVDFGELFEPFESSESDVKSLMDRLEIARDDAEILAGAGRARVFCTQNPELRRLARLLDMDVVDADEFMERFGDRKKADTDAE